MSVTLEPVSLQPGGSRASGYWVAGVGARVLAFICQVDPVG